jgi:type I restriction enzyme R subunit
MELEALYVFAKNLNRKLPRRQQHLPFDVVDALDLDSFRIQETYKGWIRLEPKDGEVCPISDGKSKPGEDETDLLSHIIKTINDIYAIGITEDDKVDIAKIQTLMESHEELQAVLQGDNTPENKRYKFNKVFDDLLLDFVNTKLDLYKKMTKPEVNAMFKRKWFEGMMAGMLVERPAAGDGVIA